MISSQKNYIWLYIFFTFFLFQENGLAQTIQYNRTKTFTTLSDTIYIDTLSIIPGSLIIEHLTSDSIIPAANYILNEPHAFLVWKVKPAANSILITYKVFPFNFTRHYFHKDISKIKFNDEIITPYIYESGSSDQKLFDFGTLNYDGSISRGISFGNSQDVVVTSGFNLQLAGMLGNDIEINAAMTDENIPIQPEGNTQQIQEFDKVYIQLKRKNSSLIMGDFVIEKPEGHFMNISKKAKGGNFATKTDWKTNRSVKVKTSMALAKGKYAKNSFQGEEGNQGPYKLSGTNGETFIIVLAGSERVFIDGHLLTRGAENDYIIDYNAAEMIFMPSRLITKDIRIVIEFEYSEQSYFRSLLHLNNEYQLNKWKVKLNVFSEQDHKGQPIQEELTDEQEGVLANAGDSLLLSVVPGIDSIAYDASRILYRVTDSLVTDTACGALLYDSVFVYSTNPDSAHYTLSFTFVGQGNGNYNLSQTAANGRVYQWISPCGGILRGSYEPIILLVSPKKQQLITVAWEYQIKKNSKLSFEAALSNHDLNTFSNRDHDDNTGYACKLGYDHVVPLEKKAENKAWKIKANCNYEFIHHYFKTPEPFRAVEFERDWNLQDITSLFDEHTGGIKITLLKPSVFQADYGISALSKGENYTGYQNIFSSKLETKGYKITAGGSWLFSTGINQFSQFLRPKFEISKKINRWKGFIIGAKAEGEQNKIYLPQLKDSLTAKSFSNDWWQFYLHTNDSLKNKVAFDFTQRTDRYPSQNDFKPFTTSGTVNLKNEFILNKNSQLRWTATYRQLSIIDTTITAQKPDESILGRGEYNCTIAKGLIESGTLYELTRGQEQKRQIAFLEVPAGEGYYIWKDYNSNNIQELYEFEEAPLFDKQANFIKVIIPTNEYEKTHMVQFNQSLDINPKAIWTNQKKIKGFLSRFATYSSMQISRKVLENPDVSPYNPFDLNVSDTSLISVTSFLKNQLFFNRSSGKFSITLNWQDHKNKSVLTSGFESRQQKEESVQTRWNISKNFTQLLKINRLQQSGLSQLSTTKNYFIQTYALEPVITYLFKSIFRVNMIYKFNISENDSNYGGENAQIHNISTELRYNRVSKSAINLKFSWIEITFNGSQNTPVAFVMLDGLQPGTNMLWSVSWDRKLSNNIQLTLIYDGRKSEGEQIIHTGKMQARYLF